MKSQINQVDGGAGNTDEVAQVGQAVVAVKAAPVALIFGILFTKLNIVFPLSAKSHLSTKTVLFLDLSHHQHVLCGGWSEPLGIKPRHDYSHEEQSHLSIKQKLNIVFIGKKKTIVIQVHDVLNIYTT